MVQCGEPMTNFDIDRREVMMVAGAETLGLTGVSMASQADKTTTEPTVYVGADDGRLYAIDADSGEQIWSFLTGEPIRSSPTVVDGVVYVGSFDGTVYAVDAASGEQRWAFMSPADGIFSSPTVVDGSAVVGANNGVLYAIDADTGDLQWSVTDPEGPVVTAPTVADGVVFAGSGSSNTSGAVYAADATTGELIWTRNLGGGIISSPTLRDDLLFVATADGVIYGLRSATGHTEWQIEASGEIQASPTVVDGTVYLTDSARGRLWAIDAQSGELEWDADPGSETLSSPTVSGDSVYVGSVVGGFNGGGSVQGYPIGSGPTEREREWFFIDPSEDVASTPTVYDRTLFAGADDRTVYAAEVETDEVDPNTVWTFEQPTDAVVSSPTVVADPADGDSVGSRTALGTLGHTKDWADQQSVPETAAVHGRVLGEVDDTTGGRPETDPLEGVTVMVEQDGSQVTEVQTKGAGEFDTVLTAPGTYELVIETDGYDLHREELPVEANERAEPIIVLSELSEPRVDIEAIRPVQVVFDDGTGFPTLVERKETAVLVEPRVENLDKMSSDTEVELTVEGDITETDPWQGTLAGQSVTLSKEELEEFRDSSETYLSEGLSRADLPLTGQLELPGAGDLASGTLELSVTSDGDVSEDTAEQNVEVVTVDPIELVFFRSSDQMQAESATSEAPPELDGVSESTFARHVENSAEYLAAVLPVAAEDLITTVPANSTVDAVRNPTGTFRSPGDARTLRHLEEAAWQPDNGVLENKGRVWAVGIMERAIMGYYGRGSGFTQAGGTELPGVPQNTVYNSMLVASESWVTTAHEMGHQLGLYIDAEEYEVTNEQGQLANDLDENGHTVRGYWVERSLLLENDARSSDTGGTAQGRTFMENPGVGNTPLEPDQSGVHWLSNRVDYENVEIKRGRTRFGNDVQSDHRDYDRMLAALRSDEPAPDGGEIQPASSDGTRRYSYSSPGTVRQGDEVDLIYIKLLLARDESVVAESDESGQLAEANAWHFYEEGMPEPTERPGEYAVRVCNEEGDVLTEVPFQAAFRGCGGGEGPLQQEDFAPVSFAIPYSGESTSVEVVSTDDGTAASSTVEETLAVFDPRVKVLQGEVASIPDRAFDTGEDASDAVTRADLTEHIDRIADLYEEGSDEAAADAIRTEFWPALDRAVTDSYDAAEPFERSRDSVLTAVGGVLERSTGEDIDGVEVLERETDADSSDTDDGSSDATVVVSLVAAAAAGYLLVRRLSDDDNEEATGDGGSKD